MLSKRIYLLFPNREHKVALVRSAIKQVAKRSAIGEVLLSIRLGSSFCCAPPQYPRVGFQRLVSSVDYVPYVPKASLIQVLYGK